MVLSKINIFFGLIKPGRDALFYKIGQLKISTDPTHKFTDQISEKLLLI